MYQYQQLLLLTVTSKCTGSIVVTTIQLLLQVNVFDNEITTSLIVIISNGNE